VLAKKTSKNQITLPKRVVEHFPGVDYFDIRKEGDRIVLEPLRRERAWEVRERLAELGITDKDVADAVGWARKGRRSR